MRSIAEVIVGDILSELSDRAGFDSWWSSIDPEVRKELKNKLEQVVEEHTR
jgi:hypothetical protein